MVASSNTTDTHTFTRDQLVIILDHCLGKTLGEVDVKRVFDKTITNPKITGIAGMVIEQSVLGYPADSRQEPDLVVDGEYIELKTTGIRYAKKKDSPAYEAKEPMSITAVSPDKIVSEQFSGSNFWHKLAKLLMVFYLYQSDSVVPAAEYANFPSKATVFTSLMSRIETSCGKIGFWFKTSSKPCNVIITTIKASTLVFPQSCGTNCFI